MNKTEINYFSDYQSSFSKILKSTFDSNLSNLKELVLLIKKLKKYKKSKIILFGNGGSSSIASHISVDLIKVCKINSVTFNEANLITCFSNDYGYGNWIKETLKKYSYPHDLIILISSSGSSENMIKAAKYCISSNLNLVTFTGFNKNNPLKKIGKINFWVDYKAYNYVEMVHHILLTSIVDYFAKK
tara:strand:+ start:2426 stop:2986 length:561 start_codon:yes stop_codon:yes gene_type:complete